MQEFRVHLFIVIQPFRAAVRRYVQLLMASSMDLTALSFLWNSLYQQSTAADIPVLDVDLCRSSSSPSLQIYTTHTLACCCFFLLPVHYFTQFEFFQENVIGEIKIIAYIPHNFYLCTYLFWLGMLLFILFFKYSVAQ